MLNVLVNVNHSNGLFKITGYLFPKPTDDPQPDVQALIDGIQKELGRGSLNYITLYNPAPAFVQGNETVSPEETAIPSAILNASTIVTVIIES